ncbi:deoxyhypusine synthase [Methanoplanus limicola]|uniref:Deoxyhypusine synthase n=1 Tax=Methanoplanus limicola DSM 2279 TaxID=937775 RepID=H1YWA4_9EURY|nr:deoxyhypusine synthase [Methanoplanus limicola]EHQ34826.1 deoxyhypusine synthase [Methanoplanus limicola DSM 2279]
MKRATSVSPSGSVAGLIEGMSKTGFQGRKLGESLNVWKRMIDDPDCIIFLGLSGAMIPAGMQKCLIELVKNRYIDGIVSTGANMFHDTCEHLGVRHYMGHHNADDCELFSRGIDRIYDVFAYDDEFRGIESEIASFIEGVSPFNASSRLLMEKMGTWLGEKNPSGESVLNECAKAGIPVFIPALCDSSVGIAVLMARRKGTDVSVDQIADVDEITTVIENSVHTGVIYVGGGVPKNFIQQTHVIAGIHERDTDGHQYAIQYTTDAPHWGGLSGCTFEEAISWGKEAPDSYRVQCFADATIALPLIVSALTERKLIRARIPDMKSFFE